MWELHGWVGQLLSQGFRGQTLWHQSNLLWGLGCLVARHWLVDDGLWGSPFGLVGSEGGGRRMHG